MRMSILIDFGFKGPEASFRHVLIKIRLENNVHKKFIFRGH